MVNTEKLYEHNFVDFLIAIWTVQSCRRNEIQSVEILRLNMILNLKGTLTYHR